MEIRESLSRQRGLTVNVIFEDYGFGTKPMDLYGVTVGGDI